MLPRKIRKHFEKSRLILNSDTNVPGYTMFSDLFFSTFCDGNCLSKIIDSDRASLTLTIEFLLA